VNRLRPGYDGRHHANNVRQHLGNGGLYDQVGGVTKCAIGGIRLPIRMRVRYLHKACERDECTTENAYRQKKLPVRSRVEHAQHCSLV
jgi:hypothetical protein